MMSRRVLLGGVAAAVGGAVVSSGCGLLPQQSVELSTAPLRLVAAAVLTAEQALNDLIATGSGGEYLPTLRENHRQHLAALRQRIGDAASPIPGATPTEPADPAARLVAAERELATLAAQRTVALPERAAGVNAARYTDQLWMLGSIAACGATHLLLLNSPDPDSERQPLVGTKRSAKTLQAVLANEHAVIYGYGALGGRLPDDQREEARTAHNRHQTLRDELSIAVADAGADPAAAAPSYRLPRRIQTPEQARALAATLEESSAAAWRTALGELGRPSRAAALAALTEAAIATTMWRLSGDTTPVAVAFPGSDTP